MKLLPIVEGCRAVIISTHPDHSRMIGATCNVIRKAGAFDVPDTISTDGQWVINIDGFVVGGKVTTHERDLMRIDGNEDLFKSEEENKKRELIK